MFSPVNATLTLDALKTTASTCLHTVWAPKSVFAVFIVIFSLLFRDFEGTTKGVTAPIAGRWPLEPYFLTGLRFKRWSMLHLSDGYKKVWDPSNLEKRNIQHLR